MIPSDKLLCFLLYVYVNIHIIIYTVLLIVSRLAKKKLSRPFCHGNLNLQLCDRVHSVNKEPKQVPVLGQINPVSAPTSNFFMIILMTFPIDPLVPQLPFSTANLYACLTCPYTYGLCPVYFIFRLPNFVGRRV